MNHFVPRQYSPVWTPITLFASELAPIPVAAVWGVVFWKMCRSAAIHPGRVLWFLLLTPFVLCYPAWAVIVLMCGMFFNWCGGPPL
jgi:hypothetical protein